MTDTEQFEPRTPNTNPEQRDADVATGTGVEKLVAELFSFGRLWAQHGLEIGKVALEHSARSLELTAGALGTISKRLGSAEDEPKA